MGSLGVSDSKAWKELELVLRLVRWGRAMPTSPAPSQCAVTAELGRE